MSSPLIDHTAHFVRQTLATAEGGHDWWHVHRVWHNARQIAAHETCDPATVELGALLHDIADAKFHNGDEEEGPRRAVAFMQQHAVDSATQEAVVHIIRHVSFRKGSPADNIELAIVQDADRLDALGAVGIARAFNYGGFKNRPIYDPEVPPRPNLSLEEYRKSAAPTLNHFYEKLLLLKDRMNTDTGRRMAEARHQFMEQYLTQFYEEAGLPTAALPEAALPKAVPPTQSP